MAAGKSGEYSSSGQESAGGRGSDPGGGGQRDCGKALWTEGFEVLHPEQPEQYHPVCDLVQQTGVPGGCQ